MTYSKVIEVLDKYSVILGAHTAISSTEQLEGSYPKVCTLCHCKWMIREIKSWPKSRLDKMFRWLGFIQGVFWCEDIYQISEMADHNRTE